MKIDESPGTARHSRDRARRADLLVYAGYLLAAVILLGELWRDPGGTVLRDNGQDQTFFEWVLSNAVHALGHGENPLFTTRLNAPDGVNMMANTSILALAIPLAPVTALFGPAVTFLILLTAALAGTAIAWYHVLSTRVVGRRMAAVVGGAFCGFAPAMISQDTGHPNVAGQYLIPFVVLATILLVDPPIDRWSPVRRGLALGGLVILQSFINEEILFLTALTLGVFVLAYTGVDRVRLLGYARLALPAFGVAAVVAGLVLAYPLWLQFSGPGSYHGLPEFVRGYSADLAAYPAFARRSLAGSPEAVEHLAQGPTEENSFFGWPLLGLLAVAVVWLRHHAGARALAITGLVFGLLSLGNEVHWRGGATGVPGPWTILAGLPLFDSVVPTRLALVLTPVIGLLLALLLDRLPAGGARLWGTVAVAVALLPVLPTPLPAAPRPLVPHFFAAGTWRQYLPADDGVVVPIPMGWFPYLDAMRWSTAARLDFAVVGGYFLGPDPGRDDRQGIFGPGYSATAQLLGDAASATEVPTVDGPTRQQVREDLRRWHATILVLPDGTGNLEVLRATVDQVAGPGVHVDDVWLWDVRAIAPA